MEAPDTLVTEFDDDLVSSTHPRGKNKFKSRIKTKSDIKPGKAAQVRKDIPTIAEVQTGVAVVGKYKGKSSGIHLHFHSSGRRRGIHLHYGNGRRRFYHHDHYAYDDYHGGSSFACFPATALVQTPEGQRGITELKVGDMVLTGDSDPARGVFSKVLFFAVRRPIDQATFLTLKTTNSTVTLTPSHAVFLADGTPILSGDLRVGQSLLSAGEIQSITQSTGVGLVAPITDTGKLVVDGVTTSDYGPMATWMGQRLAHMVLAPLQVLHWAFPEAQIWDAHAHAGVHPFKIWGSWLLQL